MKNLKENYVDKIESVENLKSQIANLSDASSESLNNNGILLEDEIEEIKESIKRINNDMLLMNRMIHLNHKQVNTCMFYTKSISIFLMLYIIIR